VSVSRSGSEPISSGVFVSRRDDHFDAQVRQAFKNLDKTLQRAGGMLMVIVWMTVAISDGR
jgi:hypothetical protein